MDIRLLIIAIIPGIALASAAYLSDRYDREPLSLLLKIFIFGAIIVIPVAIVERFLIGFNIFPGLLSAAFMAFIVAGFTEEYFKRFVVLKLAYRSKYFNEKLDGIIYAVFASLGFATVENIMYVVIRFSANPHIGLSRGIFSVPAHMLFAVTMGYYLSLAKYSQDERTEKIYMRKALIMPMILHGTFNFILMANIPLLLMLFVPYVIYLWIVNLKKLNRYYIESRTAHNRRVRNIYSLE